MLELAGRFCRTHDVANDIEEVLEALIQDLPYKDGLIDFDKASDLADYAETDVECHVWGCTFHLLEEEKPYQDNSFEHCDCDAPEVIDAFFAWAKDKVEDTCLGESNE